MFNIYMTIIIAINFQIYRVRNIKSIYNINTLLLALTLAIITNLINQQINLFEKTLDNITLSFICSYLTITAIKILIKILKEKKMVK